jgi:predicted DNA-binding transcriptional regulator YafY
MQGEGFRPLFDFPAERVLTWLSQGYGDGEPLRAKPLVPCEILSQFHRPDLERLSVITRAIYSRRAVEISYQALSSGMTSREIVPFALADSGSRWHVRAFDRRKGEFRDFVPTRIADARLVPGEPQEHELRDQDIQWNRITELELVPHPANVQHPDTIEADYGMEGGVLRRPVRAALAGYLLRHLNVDCTEAHSLKGAEYHLWLRNRQALYGVANLMLAPGYAVEERT